MEQRKKYIAYGSNMNLSQMSYRCPDAKVIGKGMIKDHELLFRGSKWNAVATVEPKVGSNVPVVIWEISSKDEKRLDQYEGYPQLYGKKKLIVNTDHGSESIMAYTMNEGFQIGKPSAIYLNGIQQGYKDAGFDVDFLMDRVAHCTGLMGQDVELEDGKWSRQQLLG